MANNLQVENLDLDRFPSINKDQWKELANKQIGGNSDEALQWFPTEGISMGAYYDAEDLKDAEYLLDFFRNVPSHQWKLYEQIYNPEEAEANSKALEALTYGADGLIITSDFYKDYNKLFKSIDLSICDVSIITDSDEISHSGYEDQYSGFVLGSNRDNCLQFDFSEDVISQISNAIQRFNGQSYIYRQAVPDFFLEIAIIRATRYLLNTIHGSDSFSIKIHTQVGQHENEESQWFLNTTAGLASILGGSNSISLSESMSNARISRNVAHLIREESKIVEYTDQCGGSYYVENLTHKIIEQCKSLINR